MPERKNICDISAFKDEQIDPYSKKDKEKIKKHGCYVTSISAHDGNVFFIGNNQTKDIMLAKGYFDVQKKFDEKKNDWESSFTEIKEFDSPRILITDGTGPNQSGILMSSDKARLVSRKLDEIKIKNDL